MYVNVMIADETAVDGMSLDEMPEYRMSYESKSISIDEMSVYQIFADEMSMDEMSVDEVC